MRAPCGVLTLQCVWPLIFQQHGFQAQHHTRANVPPNTSWCETPASTWSNAAVCFCGAHDVPLSAPWQQADEQKPCSLVRSERVSCDCALCRVGSFGEDGPCPERLRRQRETAVSLVVAADEARSPIATAPSRSEQGPSTVAWPLRKPPAYYVITSYWAL